MTRPKPRKRTRPKQDRTRKHRQKQTVTRLKERLEKTFPGRKLVIQSGQGLKMSKVLADFVEPYVELVDTEEGYRKLITVAVVAWNAALAPEKERRGMIDEVAKTMPDKQTKAEFKEIVNMLIERKQQYFSEYRRRIVDFEVTDTGTNYHLTVLSLLEDQ